MNTKYILTKTNLIAQATYTIFLLDYVYWHQNEDQLLEWCLYNNAELKGMTVELYSEESATAFKLKWQ